MYKSREQLEKENKRCNFIALLMVIVPVMTVVLIGSNNIKTTEYARYYQKQFEEQKAKAQVLEDELLDIKQSGTCLPRIPAFEA